MSNTSKRVTFSFGIDDLVMKELRELQTGEDYGLSSLSLQEILKLAVSKLKSFEKRRMSSADIETAYINSVPRSSEQIIKPFQPTSKGKIQKLETILGVK